MLSLADSPYRSDDDASVIPLLDWLFACAVRADGSDIHVDATSEGGLVRVRIDGVLRFLRSLDEPTYRRIIVRMKVLASLDIAERRMPQDGRFSITLDDRSVEMRIATLPTFFGERVAIRILDSQRKISDLGALGASPDVVASVENNVKVGGGLVVVCGPTGSGKTTTLYRLIAMRDALSEHVCTVEDPVEMVLPHVTQSQVASRAGSTFADIARALLRHDPNVVAIGEMRDAQTAAIAITAALSGHLVLTTLHASDAIGAIERLRDFGIDQSTLSYVLTCIVSQRLLRKCCSCSLVNEVSQERCSRCEGRGYLGRTGVFECIEVDRSVRQMIFNGASQSQIRHELELLGWRSMRMRAEEMLEARAISIQELLRVFGDITSHG